MAGSINGIIIELRGNPSELRKELEKIETIAGNLNKKLENGGTQWSKLGSAAENFGSKIDKVGTMLSNLGTKLSNNVTNPMLKNLGDMIKTAGDLSQVFGTVTTGVGTLTRAIDLMKFGIGNATGAAADLAKGLHGLTTPVGIAITSIGTAVGLIVTEISKNEEKIKEKFSNMGKSAFDFYQGIQTAEGYLDSFNSTLFVSTEEQQELQNQMAEIQSGITEICKTAADERRGYTTEEIIELNEYFNKLKELKNKELEMETYIAKAISQQAITNAKSFQGNLEEYKVQAQEWISTAKQQAEKTKKIIEQSSIEEIALLNQKYGENANMRNEAYMNEYNSIIEQKQQRIDMANEEVRQITEIYANNYAERASQDGDFAEHINHYNWEREQEEQRHIDRLKEIDDFGYASEIDKMGAVELENEKHNDKMRKIWQNMYKYMSDSEVEQLGVWIGMVSDAALYGGELTEENQKLVDTVLETFKYMPGSAKEEMKKTMEEMLNTMNNSEASLFAKANGISNGLIRRLSTTFNVNTRNIPAHKLGLDYVPYDNYIAKLHKGERILTAKENEQLNKFEKMPKIVDNTPLINNQMRSMDNKIICTTPNITFNVQKMDKANLDMAFNYINKRFGTQY